jgi:asparagine synthase (glutamine-hydrolysing)
MCGICGIVNFDPSEAVDRRLLDQMTRALDHRGPDDHGCFHDGNAGLGHRRLSIIDLGGGQQPIFNEDHSTAIVFNGEIYNYSDLTADLIARGHRFRTHSDTETILHAYEEYGHCCVDSLRGMFAFAVWDRRQRQLFAARDRLGVKPLYYYRGTTFFVFASELKSLLEIPAVPRQLDYDSLDLYLSLRYVPGPRTIFKDIWKLQPGHMLALEGSRLRLQQYWDIPVEPPERCSFADALEEFRQLLEESVRLRLIAEVPLGIFLSGGLDSSAILAVMSKITGRTRIKTFSVGYATTTSEEENSNELAFARLAARAFETEHHEYHVNAQEFCDAIPKFVWHLDEPLGDPSGIPLFFISKLAREHITVVLSGEGADETLGGYGIYQKMLLLETFRRTLGPLGHKLAAGIAPWVPEAASRYLHMADLSLEQRYSGVSRAFYPKAKQSLMRRSSSSGSPDALSGHFAPYWSVANGTSALNRMLYVDAKVWLPDDILLKADKMTMAHALELRVPFLDHKLVEFTASLPPQFKLRGRRSKLLLREAMRGVLPEPILSRSKKGFPVPTEQWLRGPLKGYVRETLLASDSASRQCFDPEAMETLLQEHENGWANRHQEIWTLLVFESWHRAFLEPQCRLKNERAEQEMGVS